MTFDWHPPDNDDDNLQVRQGQGDLEVNKRWAGRQSARMGGVRQVRGRAVGGSGWWTVAQGQALAGGQLAQTDDGQWAGGRLAQTHDGVARIRH
ncbi:Os08g0536600 [Oryza sativa Japonica Group]|uniref:Os08g0536600 protein n=1 Tax=Oryza sativa subsp. japonica TaxID=39947 RepID=A0A0P0XIR7_ORYSJ|nr:Os08g0536600 [Oryza sativa Japonica Group]